MRGTFTPVYAGGGGGGAVSLGGMMIPIGAMSLSSRYETPRSRVLSLADEEEEGERSDGLVEKNNNLDVVNRKTTEPERQVRVIGGEEELEDKKGLKMDVDVDVRG